MNHLMFKVPGLFVAAALLTGRVSAAEPTDQFMGDWQGSVTIGSQKQTVAVYMIPLAAGRYEARFVADFRERGPYLFRLRGLVRDDQFQFLDDIPLDAAHVA